MNHLSAAVTSTTPIFFALTKLGNLLKFQFVRKRLGIVQLICSVKERWDQIVLLLLLSGNSECDQLLGCLTHFPLPLPNNEASWDSTQGVRLAIPHRQTFLHCELMGRTDVASHGGAHTCKCRSTDHPHSTSCIAHCDDALIFCSVENRLSQPEPQRPCDQNFNH